MKQSKKELGIYIHIPFCKYKCFYCDFVSFCHQDKYIEEYVECLKKEIKQNVEKVKNEYEIITIYIGGGTPSYINGEHIKQILSLIPIKENVEVTIEVNPGTVDENKLKTYKESGINRLSIGLQTTNDVLLKQIGRIHNFEEFVNAYKLARKVGINNISVDLMLGLPNQTMQDLKNSVMEIINLNPEHISVYSLILEEGTPLCRMVNSGRVSLPEETIEREMYWMVKKVLESNGYFQYEISNFAKKGYEAVHNSNYWRQKEYLGNGISASSYLNNVRFTNISNMAKYIKNIKENNFEENNIVEEILTKQAKQKEFMLLGLRNLEGVSIEEFNKTYKKDIKEVFKKEIEKLLLAKLIEIKNDKIKLTSKGLDLANQVWMEFV